MVSVAVRAPSAGIFQFVQGTEKGDLSVCSEVRFRVGRCLTACGFWRRPDGTTGVNCMKEKGIVVGFDFGVVRIGVALGNELTCQARPLTIIHSKTNPSKWSGVSGVIEQWAPTALVVGVPRHPDGAAHEVTVLALKFARQLEGRYGLPVYVVDERYSSVVVEKGDAVIDDAAAAVILQQWFDEGCPHTLPQQETLRKK